MDHFMIRAVIRPDVVKGSPGEDLRLQFLAVAQAHNEVEARKGVIELALSNRYLVVEFLQVTPYDGPIPPSDDWQML